VESVSDTAVIGLRPPERGEGHRSPALRPRRRGSTVLRSAV